MADIVLLSYGWDSSVVLHLVVLQLACRHRLFLLVRMPDSQYAFNPHLLRKSQQLLNIALCRYVMIVPAAADLRPAAAKSHRQGRKLDNDCGDGTVLNPHIRSGAVRTYHDRQRSVFQELGTMLLGPGKLTEQFGIINHDKLPGIDPP